jgi:peptide/nickel transport system permease protein
MSAGLLRYLGTRSLRALLTVFGVVTLVFLVVRAVPGDPVDAILGDQATPGDRAAMRAALHLDAPLLTQYSLFLRDVGDGSLGHSFRRREETVASLIAQVFPATIALALAAFAVAWLLALPLGTLAAAKRGSRWDLGARGVALFGLAVPGIWLGPLLILLFGVVLRVLPLPGDEDAGARGLVLPALTVGAALSAVLTRQTRGAMIEVLSEQYVLAARARGVSTARVLVVHALRNALLPVLTVGAAQLGAVLSGTVITEKIFEREGLGSLFLDAFFARDIPVIQGCVLVVALLYVGVNLAVDVAYGLVDPRVRLS